MTRSTNDTSPPPIELPHRRDACAGVAASYVLRRIAFRAGAYAPGIQEHVFFELSTPRVGGDLASTQDWVRGNLGRLAEQGYRFGARWTSADASSLAAWVFAGRGHRGAVVPTTQPLLYPEAIATVGDHHAIGLVVEPRSGADDLVMIDPWPEGGRPDRLEAPATIDTARRDHKHAALALFWVGWS
ncbi:MAG: hypothetical protein R2939_19705 [Kofleriaceae bacterium]